MLLIKNLFSLVVIALSISCSNVPKNIAGEENSKKMDQSESKQNSVEKSFSGTIVRDCTGTYIRVEGKDYLVCNFKKIQNYKEGSKAKVSYEIPKECPEFDGIAVCMMYHEHVGMIRILSIK